MPLYIIPEGTISAESASILSRSQIPVISDGILMTKLVKAADSAQAIIQLTEDEVTVLVRNASHLLAEAPLVLTAVPGLSYRGPWMMVASRMHAVDWLTLEASLTKAGFVANNPADLQTRARTDDHVGNAKTAINNLFANGDEEEEDILGDPSL